MMDLVAEVAQPGAGETAADQKKEQTSPTTPHRPLCSTDVPGYTTPTGPRAARHHGPRPAGHLRGRSASVDMKIDAQQHERPQDDRQDRRCEQPERGDIGEVVVRAGDDESDDQPDDGAQPGTATSDRHLTALAPLGRDQLVIRQSLVV